MSDAREKATRAPKGNRNAWKHTNYSEKERMRQAAVRLLLRLTGR
jgi:hypothetical protein